jgi:predicted RNase H-like HicB family nuclease
MELKEIDQMIRPIVVNATWDAEAKVWIAESDEVPGLATGADTLEELVEKLKVAIPELLAENGIPFEAERVPFKIEAKRSEYAVIAA